MVGLRRWGVGCTMALSMSGCTLVGLGAGALVASSRNSTPEVEQGLEERTSVAKSMALGGVLGLAVDIGLVALSVSEGQFGH